MRAAFRTLATLTPLAWGFSPLGWGKGFFALMLVVFWQPAFSADYYWYQSIVPSIHYPSAEAACQANFPTSYNSVVFYSVDQARCRVNYNGATIIENMLFLRSGDSCPVGSVYNSATGACDTPPEPCPTTDIYAAVSCSFVGGVWVCPGETCRNSCSYLTSPNNTSKCDSGLGMCRQRYTGTGSACSVGSEQCTDTSCVDAPAPSEPPPAEPSCTTYEGTTVCISDENTGCGTVNGVEGCFTPDQNCGTYNGTFTCFPQDKPNNNCGYANGQKVCFDPNNPTQQIPPTSADHPNNGGNADGNDNNDPMNPAETSGTSPQGSNQGATNESVDDLGEKLGEKIDRTNSLLDGIDGVLDGIKGLLDDEYNASAESSDAEAGAAGTAAGQAMGQSVGTAVDDAVAARDAEVEQAIGAVPSTVDAFFGPSGELVPALNSLGDFFPEASSCSDYTIPINAMGVSIQVTLPVCFLSRFTSLIEWVLWCLTAIGLWNIFYSGLRLENAKASKGGF
ncbi:hypothetical protein D3C78_356610 [compost metagenome]